MSILSQVEYLLDYTEWDRDQWESWFRSQGPSALALGFGPNADGRIANIGELVRHIFSAEQRYVERIQELPLSDTSSVPSSDVDALFAFGRESRRNMRKLLRDVPAEAWDRPRELQFGSNTRTVTPRTLLVQSITHEIRHWAQMATLLRIEGRKTGVHDFLVSGVFERKLAASS
jgi:uncharacterized damage-inducible protein DinB